MYRDHLSLSRGILLRRDLQMLHGTVLQDLLRSVSYLLPFCCPVGFSQYFSGVF